MPPKVQRCSVCGTLSATKWYILDRRSICDACHDIQLNPQLEPLRERIPERLAPGGHETTDTPKESEKEAASEGKKGTEGIVEIENENILGTTGARNKERVARRTAKEGAAATTKSEASNDNDVFKAPLMISPRRLRRRVCPAQPAVRRRATKTKGKSRRTLLKKPPTKTPRETASTKTVEKVFHENMWYQIGDIVSLIDTKDNTYYAQIRGLIVDTYNEKSAVLTWLIPTTSSPPPNEGFHPATYLAGPDEDMPRCLTSMKFLMHAPSSYFLDRNNPYPRPETYGPSNTTQRDNRNYVWSSVTPVEYGEN